MTQTPDQHPDTAQEPTREAIRAHARELRAAYLAAEAGLDDVLQAPDETKGAALLGYLTATREMSTYSVKHQAELRGLSWAEAIYNDYLDLQSGPLPPNEAIRAHARELRAAYLAAEAGLDDVLQAPDETKGAALLGYLTATREMSAYSVKHQAELHGLSWAEAIHDDYLDLQSSPLPPHGVADPGL